MFLSETFRFNAYCHCVDAWISAGKMSTQEKESNGFDGMEMKKKKKRREERVNRGNGERKSREEEEEDEWIRERREMKHKNKSNNDVAYFHWLA